MLPYTKRTEENCLSSLSATVAKKRRQDPLKSVWKKQKNILWAYTIYVHRKNGKMVGFIIRFFVTNVRKHMNGL